MSMNPISLFNRLIILIFLSASAAAAGPGTRSVLAYYENDSGASSSALRSRFTSFNQLAFDTYPVNSQGIVSGDTFTGDIDFALTQKIQVFATVSNFDSAGFDASVAHSLITSSADTERFIAGILKQLEAAHYSGVNIDFESVAPSDRAAFTAFISTLAQAMHKAGYLIIISVPAELKDDPTDSWRGAYDFRVLGSLIDVLQLMTYDEYGTWSNPGPVAGLDWVEASLKYTLSVVPSAKVSLGIPAYGYDWDVTNAANNTQIPWAAVGPLLAKTKATPQWDATYSSPYFFYSLKGHQHVVWYENPRSITLKSSLVTTYNLAGVSVYCLGMEAPAFWQAIHAGGF